MAKVSKEEIAEKLKGYSKEERALFREALSTVEPEEGLSTEEVLQVREVLGRVKEKGKKGKGILETIDEIFGLK